MAAKPRQLERAEGRALMVLINGQWWARWLHHSPNEEMNPTARQIAAGQGTRPGFPDYVLPICAGGFKGFAMEMKAPKPWGRGETVTQRDWLDCFSRAGWMTTVAFGAEPAYDALMAYMDGVAQPHDHWTGGEVG